MRKDGIELEKSSRAGNGMDNLEKAINKAEQKILNLVEVAVSSEKYVVLKRHIQDAFGRNGLKGELGLDRNGASYESQKTHQTTGRSLQKSNAVHEGKRRYPTRSNQENQSHS